MLRLDKGYVVLSCVCYGVSSQQAHVLLMKIKQRARSKC
jgi:hypothetical protein